MSGWRWTDICKGPLYVAGFCTIFYACVLWNCDKWKNACCPKNDEDIESGQREVERISHDDGKIQHKIVIGIFVKNIYLTLNLL